MLGFGSPIALIAGFIFGKWLGTIIVVLGIISRVDAFIYVCKFFFKRFYKRKNFYINLKILKINSKKNEFLFFLFFRFVGSIPFQIANVLPVLFNISIKNYFVGTFLGIMPSIFILVSLGSGVEKIIKQNETAPSIVELLFFHPKSIYQFYFLYF